MTAGPMGGGLPNLTTRRETGAVPSTRVPRPALNSGGTRRRTGHVGFGGPGSRRRTGAVPRGTITNRRETKTTRRFGDRRETGVRRRTKAARGGRRGTNMDRRSVSHRGSRMGGRRGTRQASRRASRRRASRRASRQGVLGRYGLNSRLSSQGEEKESLGAMFWGDDTEDVNPEIEKKKDVEKKTKDESIGKEESKEKSVEVEMQTSMPTVETSANKDLAINLNSSSTPLNLYGDLPTIMAALITTMRREMLLNPVGRGSIFEEPLGSPGMARVNEAVWNEDKDYFLNLQERESRKRGMDASPKGQFAPVDQFRYTFDRKSIAGAQGKRISMLPWKSVTSQSSAARDLLDRLHASKKRVVPKEHWQKAQYQAWSYRRKCAEHLVHILETEQVKEMQRAVTLNRLSKRDLALSARIAKERADAADKIMRLLQDYKYIDGIEMADYLRFTLEGYKDKQLEEAMTSQKKVGKESIKMTNAQYCYLRKMKLPPKPKMCTSAAVGKRSKKKKKKKTNTTKKVKTATASTGKKKKKKMMTAEQQLTARGNSTGEAHITFNGHDSNSFFVEEILSGLRKRGIVCDDTARGTRWTISRPLPYVAKGSLRSGRFYSDLFGRHLSKITGRRELNGKPWVHPMKARTFDS